MSRILTKLNFYSFLIASTLTIFFLVIYYLVFEHPFYSKDCFPIGIGFGAIDGMTIVCATPFDPIRVGILIAVSIVIFVVVRSLLKRGSMKYARPIIITLIIILVALAVLKVLNKPVKCSSRFYMPFSTINPLWKCPVYKVYDFLNSM